VSRRTSEELRRQVREEHSARLQAAADRYEKAGLLADAIHLQAAIRTAGKARQWS
jgi:hypothetical protein